MNPILSFVFTAAAVLSLVLVCIRICGADRLKLGSHTLSLSVRSASVSKDRVTRNELLYVIGTAAFIRLVQYVFSAYAAPLFHVGDGTLTDLANRWANWDGTHYLKLAELGYTGYVEDGQHLFLVFFPLYPWLIRLLHLLIPNYQACAFIISNFSFIAGCCFLYALAAEEWNKTVAQRAVLLLSLFPFSFFFGAVRTESLFFLTSAACLYYIRRHRFLPAAVWGALASLTRMHGILLIIPAAAELLISWRPFHMLKEKRFGEFKSVMLTKAIFIPFIAVGTVLYLCLNYAVSGSCFTFLTYQKEHWFQSSQFFTKTLTTILNEAAAGDAAHRLILWLPQFFLFLFALLVLLYGIRRVSAVYSIYYLVYIFLNYSISWPLSCGRYMTCALPMFLILAAGSEKHPRIYYCMLAAFTMLLACYIPLFLNSMYLY